MLVLARKKGQSIVVNGDTEVTLLQIQGDQVRLGITAPKHVLVQRKELLGRPDNGPTQSTDSPGVQQREASANVVERV